MVRLDVTIVQIALPSAQRALHFSTDSRQWIITAYAAALGSMLLFGGKLGDLFGRKCKLITGLGGIRDRIGDRWARAVVHDARRGARCRECSARCSRPPRSGSQPGAQPTARLNPRQLMSTAINNPTALSGAVSGHSRFTRNPE